jgi:hypothetical protein
VNILRGEDILFRHFLSDCTCIFIYVDVQFIELTKFIVDFIENINAIDRLVTTSQSIAHNHIIIFSLN